MEINDFVAKYKESSDYEKMKLLFGAVHLENQPAYMVNYAQARGLIAIVDDLVKNLSNNK